MTLEELQELYLKSQNEVEELKKENGNLTKMVDDSKEQITSLQQHNQKLFLKATESVTRGDDVDTEDKIKSIDDILSNYIGG